MDRKYIESQHIVERYLSGDLTVREARDFEKFCLENPDYLNKLPIPVRLKARLARRPLDSSETGMFPAIPSTATRAAAEVAEEGFDAAEEAEQEAAYRRMHGGGGPSRMVFFAVSAAFVAALAGLIVYASRTHSLSDQIAKVQREASASQMQAPSGMQTHRLQLSRSKPEQATLAVGWMSPAQLLDLHIDTMESRYNAFQVTIDKDDGLRIMQIRRISRDSNRELRLLLNSSAFGRGDLLLRFDGYNWRGQTEELGWIRLGLQ